MKNRILTFLLLLLVAAGGCKKDDPCDGISCLNGGTCANGVCNCPTGYTGPDCSEQDTPNKISITNITVTKFPVADANGSSWDVANGADVYLQLSLNGVEIANNSIETITNATSVPFTWTMAGNWEIDDPTNDYTLTIYDRDDFDADDLMAYFTFTAYNTTGGFPLTISVGNSIFQVDLWLEYDF